MSKIDKQRIRNKTNKMPNKITDNIFELLHNVNLEKLVSKYGMSEAAGEWALQLTLTQGGYIRQLIKASNMYKPEDE